jgi:hypothetical protein
VAWLVSSVIAFAAAVVLHAGLVRVVGSANKVVAFLATGGLVGLALGGYELAAGTHTTLEMLAALLIYALACELYIFVFTLVASSVSVAVVLALDREPLSEDALEHRYSGHAMVEARVGGLITAGCLERRDGLCVVTRRGRTLALIFERLRRVFGHAP